MMRIAINKSCMIAGAAIFFVSMTCYTSTPMNIFHDPALLQGVSGLDSFYSRPEKRLIIDFLPFYNNSSWAKNASGSKVPEGDVFGRWNMIGLVHGTGGAPGGALSSTTTPSLYSASNALSVASQDYTDNNYTDTSQRFGYFSVPIKYEKLGVRGRVQVPLAAGFGLSFKGGFVYYKQTPTFNDQTSTATATGFSTSDINITTTHLMVEQEFDAIAQEIGLNTDSFSKTAAEDLVIELCWNGSLGMDDEDGNHAVDINPFFSCGVIVPTGNKKDPDKAFSLPTGNDGFFAFTAQADVGLNFPESIEIDFGAGVSLFESKIQTNQRVPTSLTQQSIYPWKATIYRRPGPVWNLHTGFKARDFIENLTFYGNFIYTKHERDRIRMRDSATRNTYFKPEKLEAESAWESKMYSFGLDYKITPELELGFAVQAPITGRRIYRTTTLMGSLKFLI
jgi:hypothetical protein